jgi:hypothetical protein
MDLDLGITNCVSYGKTIKSPIIEPFQTNLERNNTSVENSSTVYNEPFSDDDSCSLSFTVKTKKQHVDYPNENMTSGIHTERSHNCFRKSKL